jgi:hypothetical protein
MYKLISVNFIYCLEKHFRENHREKRQFDSGTLLFYIIFFGKYYKNESVLFNLIVRFVRENQL